MLATNCMGVPEGTSQAVPRTKKKSLRTTTSLITLGHYRFPQPTPNHQVERCPPQNVPPKRITLGRKSKKSQDMQDTQGTVSVTPDCRYRSVNAMLLTWSAIGGMSTSGKEDNLFILAPRGKTKNVVHQQALH